PSPLGTGSGGTGSLAPQLAIVALIAAGGLWLWKRRARGAAPATKPPKILARTSVGVRSELLVVEVEGQTMLIGVTPGSIQRIAVLSASSEMAAAEPAESIEPVEDGFRDLVQRATLPYVEPE